jgi:hypothetical protein
VRTPEDVLAQVPVTLLFPAESLVVLGVQGAAMQCAGGLLRTGAVPGWFGSAIRRLQDIALDRAQTQPHEVGIGRSRKVLVNRKRPSRPRPPGKRFPRSLKE